MHHTRYRQWLLALFTLATLGIPLSGCQNFSSNELVTSIAELTTAESEETEVSEPAISSHIPDNTPEGVVNRVMDAINQRDAATLAKYMANSGDNSVQAAEAAIADYKTYFLNGRLVDLQPLDPADAAEGPQRYELVSDTGLTKVITVVQQAEQLKVSDEFLDYSGLAKAQMSNFVAALQNQDAEQLAAALSTPRYPYSTYWAGRAIALYQERMNLDTLAFKFVDLNPATQQFTYSVVSETPEGYKLEHDVTVTFGDGQVSIQDAWLP